MNATYKILALLSLLALLLSACAGSSVEARPQDGSGEAIRVVATTGMITDLVQNVGGERVQVTGLMGPGVDPHLYKASEGDLRAIEKAEVIFFNGLHLEANLANVLERMTQTGKAVAISEKIDPTRLNAPPEFGGNYDPHIWFDVTLWKTAVEPVRDALIKIDPAGEELFRSNADRYLKELDALDGWIRQQVERIPAEHRVLITAHDAFNYFGKQYGFEVRGLQGINTASEAGTADVQSLSSFIVERQIPAIFVESSVPQRNIEAVQAAVRAKGFEVKIGGQLFSDAMGTAGTPEGTYIGMFRYNLNTIVQSLVEPPVGE
jgi:manganese/zinc/iron transport system substrate-binding protein